MTIFACGLNHKTASIELREKFIYSQDNLIEPLQELISHADISEAAILSTCNRTEIYCETEHQQTIFDWLSQTHHISQKELQTHIYTHQEHQAVRHMMRVACGLDSMMLGEPQILGQLKTAYAKAIQAGTIGTRLNQIFNRVFSTSKHVRTNTDISVNPISISYAAAQLAKKIVPELKQSKVLLIGTGETIQLTAKYLHQFGVHQFFIANRTQEKAEVLAKEFDGITISVGQIQDYLHTVDVVITATACPLPFIEKSHVIQAQQTRKERPLFLVDLAVPRDIEVDVKSIDHVHLYNVDDLQQVVVQGMKQREAAAEQAEALIDVELDRYKKWQQSLNAEEIIRTYREHVESIGQQELHRAMQALKKGVAPEAVLYEMNHRMKRKITHQPSVKLKAAAIDEQQALLDIAKSFLDIK